MVWMWPMGHCGMDVAYETLWYGCDLWDTVVWMWPMRHCGMDVTYETLWYGCDLWDTGMDVTMVIAECSNHSDAMTSSIVSYQLG